MPRNMFLRFGLESQPDAPKRQKRTWKPGEDPCWILLIDGKYEIDGEICQGWPYTMHYVGRGGGSGFYLTHRQDGTCVPCHEINVNGAQNISVSQRVLMTAFWPGWFHLVEKEGKKGKYKQKELCRKPQFCAHCGDRNAEEPTYGRRLPWGMPANDANVLMDRALEISKMCKSCGGEIYPLAIICPKCKHTYYDLTRIQMDHKIIMDTLDERRVCPNCQTEEFPGELLKCSNDCTEAVRCTIFDVMLKVKTIQTGKNSYYQLSIVEHSKPITLQEIIERDHAQAAFKDYHAEPIDADAYVEPESADMQAAKLNCTNPYSSSRTTKHDPPPTPYGR